MMQQPTTFRRGLLLAVLIAAAMHLAVPGARAQERPEPSPPPLDAPVASPPVAPGQPPANATTHGLRVLAKAAADSVILRWAPTSARAWRHGNAVGYVVERLRVGARVVDSLGVERLRDNLPADGEPVDEAAVLRVLESINLADVDTAAVRRGLRAANVPRILIDDLLRRLQADVTLARPEDFRPVVADTLRPWPLATWGQYVEPNNPADRYAGVALQMLYGETVIPAGTGPYARLKMKTSTYKSRYGFSLLAADLDATAARGLALRLTDTDVQPREHTYVYRVYPAVQPDSFTVDTAYVRVGPTDLGPQVPPPAVQAKVTQNKTILRWPRAGLNGDGAYTAYYIERADGRKAPLYPNGIDATTQRPQAFTGGAFQRLNDLPYLPLRNQDMPTTSAVFTDSTAVATQEYTYRVYGITPFATLSLPAQVRVRGRDLVAPPTPRITQKEQVKGSTVRIQWELPQPAPDDLAGFEVGISNAPDGPFIADSSRGLLPPTTRQTTDSRALSRAMNYYVVTAIDTAGNRARSSSRYIHLIDSIPPPPPHGLTARADTNGIVTLQWARNSAPDLQGYKVFQSNDADDPVTLETGRLVPDTVYVDTLEVQSLTREAFFAVEAVDGNYNVSEKTRIRVELPDVVSPTAPVIRKATPTARSVQLVWTASVSADVAHHLVMRRPAPDSAWTTLATLPDTAEAYTDAAVVQNRAYTYRIVAEDSTGLRSTGGRPVAARPYDTGVRPGVQQLEAIADDEAGVALTWTYDTPAQKDYWFVVYRSTGTSGLQRYRATETPRFQDAVATGASYQYAVQVVYEDGGQSRLSERVTVAPEP
ncbi:fibronectin type III domain-containing protein [Salisaeta longa]|uniref:fibronectin type III domain-containing protein n=1 Tax=Salisaeta longa TaxID=503170 RepID=UPI0003B509B4|nr:hypothetical protein [Salisaeta longa]